MSFLPNWLLLDTAILSLLTEHLYFYIKHYFLLYYLTLTTVFILAFASCLFFAEFRFFYSLHLIQLIITSNMLQISSIFQK